MGVYIKGMEMPTDCRTCQMKMNCTDCEGWECCCLPLGKEIGDIGELLNDRRRDDCPLVPVKPHGRLIDADALMREFDKAQRTMAQHGREYSCSFMSSSQELSTEWYCVEDMVENAPTILEAEEGET